MKHSDEIDQDLIGKVNLDRVGSKFNQHRYWVVTRLIIEVHQLCRELIIQDSSVHDENT